MENTTTTSAGMKSDGQSYATGISFNTWTEPYLVETIVNGESIELIYKKHSLMSNNFGSLPSQVFKIIYSCKDGKWHESKPIVGEIIEATKESYEFTEE